MTTMATITYIIDGGPEQALTVPYDTEVVIPNSAALRAEDFDLLQITTGDLSETVPDMTIRDLAPAVWLQPRNAGARDQSIRSAAAGSPRAVAEGDPVGQLFDLSGHEHHFTALEESWRPVLQGRAVGFDGVDDYLQAAAPIAVTEIFLVLSGVVPDGNIGALTSSGRRYIHVVSDDAISIDGADGQTGGAALGEMAYVPALLDGTNIAVAGGLMTTEPFVLSVVIPDGTEIEHIGRLQTSPVFTRHGQFALYELVAFDRRLTPAERRHAIRGLAAEMEIAL